MVEVEVVVEVVVLVVVVATASTTACWSRATGAEPSAGWNVTSTLTQYRPGSAVATDVDDDDASHADGTDVVEPHGPPSHCTSATTHPAGALYATLASNVAPAATLAADVTIGRTTGSATTMSRLIGPTLPPQTVNDTDRVVPGWACTGTVAGSPRRTVTAPATVPLVAASSAVTSEVPPVHGWGSPLTVTTTVRSVAVVGPSPSANPKATSSGGAVGVVESGGTSTVDAGPVSGGLVSGGNVVGAGAGAVGAGASPAAWSGAVRGA